MPPKPPIDSFAGYAVVMAEAQLHLAKELNLSQYAVSIGAANLYLATELATSEEHVDSLASEVSDLQDQLKGHAASADDHHSTMAQAVDMPRQWKERLDKAEARVKELESKLSDPAQDQARARLGEACNLMGGLLADMDPDDDSKGAEMAGNFLFKMREEGLYGGFVPESDPGSQAPVAAPPLATPKPGKLAFKAEEPEDDDTPF